METIYPKGFAKGTIVKIKDDFDPPWQDMAEIKKSGCWLILLSDYVDGTGSVEVYTPADRIPFWTRLEFLEAVKMEGDLRDKVLSMGVNTEREKQIKEQTKNGETKMSKDIIEIAKGNASKSVKIVSQTAAGHVALTNIRKLVTKGNPVIGAMLATKYGKLVEGAFGVVAPTLVEAYRPDDKRLMWAAEALQQATAAAGGFEAGESINELLDAMLKGVKTPYDED